MALALQQKLSNLQLISKKIIEFVKTENIHRWEPRDLSPLDIHFIPRPKNDSYNRSYRRTLRFPSTSDPDWIGINGINLTDYISKQGLLSSRFRISKSLYQVVNPSVEYFGDFYRSNYDRLSEIIYVSWFRKIRREKTPMEFYIPITKIPLHYEFYTFRIEPMDRVGVTNFLIYNSEQESISLLGTIEKTFTDMYGNDENFLQVYKPLSDYPSILIKFLQELMRHHAKLSTSNQQSSQNIQKELKHIKAQIASLQKERQIEPAVTEQRIKTNTKDIEKFVETLHKQTHDSLHSLGSSLSNIQKKLKDLEDYTGRIKILLDEHVRQSKQKKEGIELRQHVLKELKKSQGAIKLLQEKIKRIHKPTNPSKTYRIDQRGQFIP